MYRRIYIFVVAVLIVSLSLPVLFPTITPQQHVTASNESLESIPAPEAIFRAIPNTGEGFFVPPPAADLRLSPNAPEAATFNVTYNGFPPQAQAAFQYAVNIWAGLLDSSVTININATWTPLASGVLGSAGAVALYNNLPGAPAANTWFPNALIDKRSCSNVGGLTYDIVANFNSTFPSWYLGTDGLVPTTQWDFVTVVLHEIGHGLGFAGSFVEVQGNTGRWDTNQSSGSGVAAIYTRFVRDGYGAPIISYGSPSPDLAIALQGGAGGLFWTGRFGTAGNGGVQPTLYSPVSWEEGSSFSHFDQTTYGTELLKPALPNGVAIHSPGTRTLGVLRDIGWGDELVIQAYGYDTSGVVEWVQLRNNASVAVNLSDYAIGDEERQGAAGEGMFLLPNVDLTPNALFTMRVRSDGDWVTAYPGDPNPTYCWNCTSGYTNLTNYNLWGGVSGTLDNLGDEIVLLRTNGGAVDVDGVVDDFIVDAMCYGSGQTYIDTDGGGTLNNRDKTIFTDGTCLSLLPSGSFQRSSTVETCVPSTALINNPTAVSVKALHASATTDPRNEAVAAGLLSVAVVLVGGFVTLRRRSTR